MIIDDQTFTDFALHLRRASDGLLAAARRLAAMCDEEGATMDEGELMRALESLVAMNREFVLLEGILRTVWESNRPAGAMTC